MQVLEVLKEAERHFLSEGPKFYLDLNSEDLDLFNVSYREDPLTLEKELDIQNLSREARYVLKESKDEILEIDYNDKNFNLGKLNLYPINSSISMNALKRLREEIKSDLETKLSLVS